MKPVIKLQTPPPTIKKSGWRFKSNRLRNRKVMNIIDYEKIIKRLSVDYSCWKDKTFTGKEVLEHIQNMVKDLTPPLEVQEAMRLIWRYEENTYRLFSDEYFEAKRIVRAHEEVMRQKYLARWRK